MNFSSNPQCLTTQHLIFSSVIAVAEYAIGTWSSAGKTCTMGASALRAGGSSQLSNTAVSHHEHSQGYCKWSFITLRNRPIQMQFGRFWAHYPTRKTHWVSHAGDWPETATQGQDVENKNRHSRLVSAMGAQLKEMSNSWITQVLDTQPSKQSKSHM